MTKNIYRILVVGGDSWNGSDCTGLARGFRALGHLVELIGADQFFPKVDRSFSARLLRKIISPFFANQFNNYIVNQLSFIRPDMVVIFKGNYVKPETLSVIREKGIWLCNFYPDVSFFCHKDVDPTGFKFYDHIFTTKSFGVNDLKQQLGLQNASFLPHGFDSAVHRPVTKVSHSDNKIDASFIGTWSPHKQAFLEGVMTELNEAKLYIWGNQWNRVANGVLKKAIMGHPVLGDFYAFAIGNTKINIGLLSEQQEGASSGDKITSRTFQIPASGGFLLHERTEEVLEYYEEGKEIACFDSIEELVEKIQYYLDNEEERNLIANAGYERCIKENSLTNRAQVIISKFENDSNISIKNTYF